MNYLFGCLLSFASIFSYAQAWQPLLQKKENASKSVLAKGEKGVGLLYKDGKTLKFKSTFLSPEETVVSGVDPEVFAYAAQGGKEMIALLDASTYKISTYVKENGIWNKGTSNLGGELIYFFHLTAHAGNFYFAFSGAQDRSKNLRVLSSSDGKVFKDLPTVGAEKGRVNISDIKFDNQDNLCIAYFVSAGKSSLLKTIMFDGKAWSDIAKPIKHKSFWATSLEFVFTKESTFIGYRNDLNEMKYDLFELKKGKWSKLRSVSNYKTRFTYACTDDNKIYFLFGKSDASGKKTLSVNFARYDGTKLFETKSPSISSKNLMIKDLQIFNNEAFIIVASDGTLHHYKVVLP